MTIEIVVRTLLHCVCVLCGHKWDAETRPERCSKCKRFGWNGEDRRLTRQAVPSRKKPRQVRPMVTLAALETAYAILNDIEPRDQDLKDALAQLDRQIALFRNIAQGLIE